MKTPLTFPFSIDPNISEVFAGVQKAYYQDCLRLYSKIKNMCPFYSAHCFYTIYLIPAYTAARTAYRIHACVISNEYTLHPLPTPPSTHDPSIPLGFPVFPVA